MRWTAVVLATLFSAAPVLAQDAQATAQALFEQARAAFKSGDYAAACSKFRESDRLDPASGTKFGLAECEEKRGKLATAWALYKAAAETMKPGNPRIGVARERAAALEPRVPRLVIKLRGKPPPETKVMLDSALDVTAAGLGTPLPVDPGAHVLTVEAPERVETRLEITLREGQQLERTLAVGEKLEPPTDVSRDKERSPQPRQNAFETREGRQDAPASGGGGAETAGYVVGAIGLAAIVVGGAFYVVASVNCPFWDNNCNDKAEAKKWQTAAIVTAAIGGVVAVTGGVLVLTSKPNEPQRAALRCAPTLGIDGAACTLEGRW